MPNVKEFYLNKLDGSCDFEMDDNSVRSMKLVDVQSLVSGAWKSSVTVDLNAAPYSARPGDDITSALQSLMSAMTAGGTLGQLSVALTAGTGFSINSSSGSETSTIFWELVRA